MCAIIPSSHQLTILIAFLLHFKMWSVEKKLINKGNKLDTTSYKYLLYLQSPKQYKTYKHQQLMTIIS